MPNPEKSSTNMVRWVVIEEEYAGQRIDNFLLAQLKGLPRSRIYSMVRKGEVRVNKGRIKVSYRIAAGDSIRIPPVRVAERAEPVVPSRLINELEAAILYEDDRLLILNKPSGVAVHGGSGLSWGVIEALRASNIKRHYIELVHRIDRDTSGCLMLAKRRSALRSLHEQMRASEITKRYLALVKGDWPAADKRITYPLRKNTLSSGERLVRVADDGKDAISLFVPRKRFAKATLMQVDVITGRTHQIRVHAAHHGHPLAGDNKYGDAKFDAELKKLGLKRLFLHACELELIHPHTNEKLQIRAPLPNELNKLLERLE
ncbi:MAG: 23S rRNA pseudouridine(955/2504/2580) synthase RluC [Gammaproteobacteria bacterium]|nr:23S rRNA pseudouridine(955/2504/2580) synthase RluC [Gammaproteobacteria bacterium]PCH62237.1 MAG: 23S rRNA pseudouridine(955/2504/2580) synthase RluC [Gammaproteobacteria bacterium]